MTEVISDIKIMEIACAWIQRGASYFVYTYRSIQTYKDEDVTNFEDDFGDFAAHQQMSTT